MKLIKHFKTLCRPAFVYFTISIIGIFIIFLQNIGNNGKYQLGNFSCNVPSTFLIFIIKLIYIIFWTWILDLICKDGHRGISWFLVLFPFILIFVIIGLFFLYSNE